MISAPERTIASNPAKSRDASTPRCESSPCNLDNAIRAAEPETGCLLSILQIRISGTIRAMEVHMATAQNTLVVDLGPMRQSVEERIQSGSYANADEVIRAGLRALDREESARNEWLTQLAEESMADPRPSVPAAQVFRELRAKYGIPASELHS
jgi:antitoxin ParD1/3/4